MTLPNGRLEYALTTEELLDALADIEAAITAGTPTGGALTDTQLRATAVPVSGPLTDTQLRAAAVPIIDGVRAVGSTSGIEHLVLTAGSTYTVPVGTKRVSVSNRGPNSVYVAWDGVTASSSHGIRLAAFGGVATDPEDGITFYMISGQTAISFLTTTANQVTGAGIYISCEI
jgi:hypothetical protein